MACGPDVVADATVTSSSLSSRPGRLSSRVMPARREPGRSSHVTAISGVTRRGGAGSRWPWRLSGDGLRRCSRAGQRDDERHDGDDDRGSGHSGTVARDTRGRVQKRRASGFGRWSAAGTGALILNDALASDSWHYGRCPGNARRRTSGREADPKPDPVTLQGAYGCLSERGTTHATSAQIRTPSRPASSGRPPVKPHVQER